MSEGYGKNYNKTTIYQDNFESKKVKTLFWEFPEQNLNKISLAGNTKTFSVSSF